MICLNDACNTNGTNEASAAPATNEESAVLTTEPLTVDDRPKPRTTRGVLTFFAAAVVGSAALAAVGLAPRSGQEADLTATTLLFVPVVYRSLRAKR